jgi:hypothetical protein
MELAMKASAAKQRPIFALFAKWPGCDGCKDAGRIFSDAVIVRAVNEFFIAAAFNTNDLSNEQYSQAHQAWGGELQHS